MWLMPMLIGNAVHGNADNPPVPMVRPLDPNPNPNPIALT